MKTRYLMAAALVAGLATPAAAQSIATTDGGVMGQRLEVTELKRLSGNRVMLKFMVINETKENLHRSTFGTGSEHDATTAGIYLVDGVNGKKHLVLRDSEGKCLCSQGLSHIAAGASFNMWASFPAPPAGVDMLAINFPQFQPLEDVPLSE